MNGRATNDATVFATKPIFFLFNLTLGKIALLLPLKMENSVLGLFHQLNIYGFFHPTIHAAQNCLFYHSSQTNPTPSVAGTLDLGIML